MDQDVIVCRCRDITAREVAEAVPLSGASAGEVRRLSGAGMGFCQGTYCQDLMRRVIVEATGAELGRLLPARVRAPIVPVQLALLAQLTPDKVRRRRKSKEPD